MFKNRVEAGEQLAGVLALYKNQPDTVVIALPRGGVVPAYVVATALNLPLEVAMVKKLGHPGNREYAIGAVSMNKVLYEGYEGVTNEYIDEQVKKLQAELKERYKLYHGNKPPIQLNGKTVIVIDDGIATGKTLLAAIELMQSEGAKKVVIAVPVAPKRAINYLKGKADEVYCLQIPHVFKAIGLFYHDFSQVTDEEVIELLKKAAAHQTA